MAEPLAARLNAGADSSAPALLELALAHAGEGQAWLVGGFLRDRLLGRASTDIDLVVRADAKSLGQAIAQASAGTCFVLDELREVVRVIWFKGPLSGLSLDLAGLLAESIEDDLRQRDLSVNAMALPLDAACDGRMRMGAEALRSALLDPLHGLGDLDARLLRVTDPRALDRDSLRLLRAPRLAAELGFELESTTADAIRQRASLASQPAGERQRVELLRLLAADRGGRDLAGLGDLGLLAVLLPELEAARGVPQSPPHDRDVFEHSLSAMAAMAALTHGIDGAARATGRIAADAADPLSLESAGGILRLDRRWERVIAALASPLANFAADHAMDGFGRQVWWRLAALLHDIGKPETFQRDPMDGRSRFPGHEQRGAEMSENLAHRFRLSRQAADFLRLAIGNHLRPLRLVAGGGADGRSVYRYYRATEEVGVDIALMALADNAAKGPLNAAFAGQLATVCQQLLSAWLLEPERSVHPALPVDGKALMRALNLKASPELGRLLEEIAEAVAAGEVRDAEGAIELVRSIRAGAR